MKNHFRIVTHPLATLCLLAAAVPASAHHPMGGATPGTLMEGLLSGFGHPIIGIDHLLFIVAVGVACYCFGQRIATAAVFLAGALAGTLVHLQAPNVPYADAWVAASLILLGVMFFRRSAWLHGKTAMMLFGLSGLAHGYAYGEAIAGAESTPLLAYLAGFTLTQLAIALCGYAAARYAASISAAPKFLKAAGSTLSVVGAGFLVFALGA
jgi:urease accessory protein